MFRKVLSILVMLLGILLIASCSPRQAAPTAQPTTSIANPASVFCEQHGGAIDVKQDSLGNVSGVCHFPDGSVCDEWAYYRAECKPGDSLSTPQPAATPTLLPSSPTPNSAVLRVAYFGAGKIMLWDGGAAPHSLVAASGVEQVRISDDGAVVAYLGHDTAGSDNIFAVNSDGSNPRILVGKDYLSAIQPAYKTISIDFAPASHMLYFATDQYDLHRVDAGGGSPVRLFDAGKGGFFSFSPDGQWMALYHPNELALAPLSGPAAPHVAIQFPADYTSTLGPEVAWKPDSSGLYLVSASGAPGSANNMTVWFVPVTGDPIRQMAYTGPYAAHLSPDGQTVVYLDDQKGPVDVHIVTAGGKDTVYATLANASWMGWTPDGQHFTLNLSTDLRLSVPYLCAAGGQPVKLNTLDDAESLTWVDAQRALFASHGLALYLQTQGQPATLIDANASSWFDYTNIKPAKN